MKLSDYQKQLWESMIRLTDEYLNTKITFSYLVPSLEGLLDASEIKDKEIIKQWYDNWTPLEIINAEQEIKVSEEEKSKEVKKMKDFLIRMKDQVSS